MNSCKSNDGAREKEKMLEEALRREDSLSEVRIDSANISIKNECDTLLKYKVPALADAVIKKDTFSIRQFSDSLCTYHDKNRKVEKVILRLKADCIASLLKETYKRARKLQKAGLKRPPGAKRRLSA